MSTYTGQPGPRQPDVAERRARALRDIPWVAFEDQREGDHSGDDIQSQEGSSSVNAKGQAGVDAALGRNEGHSRQSISRVSSAETSFLPPEEAGCQCQPCASEPSSAVPEQAAGGSWLEYLGLAEQ